MKRQLWTIILIGALVASVAACGGKDNPDAGNEGTQTTLTPQNTKAPDGGTDTPAPTKALENTEAPQATKTPAPTVTNTPQATNTPQPTEAPTITPTAAAAQWEMNGTTLIIRDNCGMDEGLSASKYPWYSEREKVEHIVIEDGVTVISENAFDSFTAVKTVIMADSVTKIEKNAFDDMAALESISLSQKLTYVGENAFRGCKALKKIELPESVDEIGAGAFKNCEALVSVVIHGDITTIGDGAFSGTDALELFRVTGSIVNVGEEAVGSVWRDGTRDKLMIEIAGGITGTIGKNAFANCAVMTAVKLCEGLTSIDDNAFLNCAAWGETSLVLPSTLTYIGGSAFEGCGITELTVSSDVTAREYICTTLTTVHFAENVTAVPAHLFKNMKIERIELPAGIIKIGEKAFANCTSLKEVILPEGLQEIGAGAFQNCYKLETADIPTTVTAIGEEAFQSCYVLKEVKLPEGLRQLGEYAFNKCRAIISVRIPGSLEIIEAFAFQECDALAVVIVEEGVKEIEKNAFASCKALVAVSLPDSVVYLGDKVFAFCNALPAVDLPVNLESLGSNAFQDCRALTELVIPEKITHIYSYTFSGCNGLAKLELPVGIKDIVKNAVPKTTVIYGVTGSYAENFAAEQGLTFVAGTIAESNASAGNTPVVEIATASSLFDINAVHEAATGTVEKLRENGLLAEGDICLFMDNNKLSFDITPENNTIDMVLSVDASGVYTLALDYDFWFLEGFGPLVNGIDPAPYNKEMLQNFLGLISEEPMELFNTIDLVYFSSYGLSGTGYLAVGDCYMMDGLDSVPGAWSFKIKK